MPQLILVGVLALLLVIVIGGGLLVARGDLARLGRGAATPPSAARVTPGIPVTPVAGQESLRSVRETVAANPNDAGVQLRLAEFLERTRDFTGAFAAYDIAIRIKRGQYTANQLWHSFYHANFVDVPV